MFRTDLPNECEFCGYKLLLNVILGHPSQPTWGDPEREREYAERERYVVCAGCHVGLITLSLAPWQFLRAKESGGDVNRYYLHDDFYDRDTGDALQPKMEGLTRSKPHSWGDPMEVFPPKVNFSEVDNESDPS